MTRRNRKTPKSSWADCQHAIATGQYTHDVATKLVTVLAICPAPQPYRADRLCGRLFVRRGQAKLYCSDTCRARVATRRARGIQQ